MNSIKRKILPKYNKAKRKLAHGSVYLKRKLTGKKGVSNGADLDQKLVYSLSGNKIPGFRQLKHIKKVLGRRELWLLRFFFLVIIVSAGWIGFNFYNEHLEKVPVSGGEYVEGVVGNPGYINPLYSSINDLDSDLSGLIYSSLYRYNNKGELEKDLVAHSERSDNDTEYTLKIREDVYWHNGDKLTAEDIVFTFEAIKNSDYNSPLRSDFSGVEIEKTGEYKVRFNLSQPYASFEELLTFGILPAKLWRQIPPSSAKLAELNLKPIGSGPYKFNSLAKDKSGNIRSYDLVKNDGYYRESPYIEKLSFRFFVDHIQAIEHLNQDDIDGLSYLPPSLKEDVVARDSLSFHDLSLFKISSIFLNQKGNPFLEDKKVRQALAYITDRDRIINQALEGNAESARSPLPSSHYAYDPEVTAFEYQSAKAAELFAEAGWESTEISQEEIDKIEDKKAELEESKSGEESEEEGEGSSEDSSEEPEELSAEEEKKLQLGAGEWLRQEEDEDKYLIIELSVAQEEKTKVAEMIKEQWEEAGVKVLVRSVSFNEFSSSLLDSRQYDALIHSQVVDDESDIYTFWHSSQATSGGLNVANYENEEVDELLERGRTTFDKEKRGEIYRDFQGIVVEEVPAIFLYSPTYPYVQSKKVKGFDVESIRSSKNRFSNISEWYIKTGEKIVW